MSIQAVGWALDQDLPARPKLVLVSLANHADKATGYCWLNAETIAQEAACKPRSVYRFIAALVHNGYVRREKRRGADGKQRANDYWILFNRPEASWVELGTYPEPGDDDAPETHGSDDADPQDVEGQNDDRVSSLSPGKSDSPVTRQDENAHAVSPGPSDSGVSHIDSAEPSKTNPKSARAAARVPRGYKAPPPTPPPPVGATTCDGSGPMLFVFVGTPAYEAWQRVKARETGRPWALRTSREGKFGWYFPTLYPPTRTGPPASADGPLATDQDLDEFAKTG